MSSSRALGQPAKPTRRRLAPVETKGALLERMGAWEVAECLGVERTNLQFIKDLPEPVEEVRATRLWLAEEIREFAKVYNLRRQARAAG